MDKEKWTDTIRNILWGVLLLLALYRGFATGHWRAFIFLAVLFVLSKGALLIAQLKLRKTTKELETLVRPSYTPKPDEIEAIAIKAEAIANEIKRHCPSHECLRFAIDQSMTPSIFDNKLGGTPYWDASQPYPTDSNGMPMAMVLQVNFEQCPHIDPLPKTGMLQYFITSNEKKLEEGYGIDYDNPTSQANCRVVYHPVIDHSIDSQQPPQHPHCENLKYSPVLGEYALSVKVDESCVNVSCNNFENLFADAVKTLYGDSLETPFFEAYLRKELPEEHRWDVEDELVTGGNPIYYGPSEDSFQMLGYPAFEQYDERPDGCPQDTLLAQIPSISASEGDGWCTLWGDCGSIRLFIRADDLRRQDFSHIYYDFQCY